MTNSQQHGKTDPVRRDQSKYADEAGVLRYSADDSEVFPGPTGVRDPKALGYDE